MIACEVMDVSKTYYDHFTIYTYNESLHCTTKTNMKFYVNWISFKKERERW